MQAPAETTTSFDPGQWARLAELIERFHSIVISSHIHPDGDAVGAALALRRLLEAYGKDAKCLFSHPAGRQLERFCRPGEYYQYEVDEFDLSDRDLIIAVDASDWSRLGVVGDVLQRHPAAKAIIDHHPTTGEADCLRIVDTNASSTTVLIHRFLEYMKIPLTQVIAEPIYLGMIVDTINFHLPNTTPEAFRIAAACVEAGVKPPDVYEPVFGTMRFSRMRLMAEVFSGAQVLFDGKVGVLHTTLDMMSRCMADEDDDDGFSDLSRNIEGVSVGVYLRELPENRVKVSWRTKDPFSIVEAARRFGGGGHLRACGAMLHGEFVNVKQQVIDDLEERVKSGAFDLD